MAQYIGQITGNFTVGEIIIDTCIKPIARKNREVARIVKIGIQADSPQTVFLNGVAFEIGKTGILQFNDINITSIIFAEHPYKRLVDEQGNFFTNAIIDYLYEDDTQGMVLVDNSFNTLKIENKQASIMEHEDNE